MLIISSSRILVKRESTSRLHLKKSESFSIVYPAKAVAMVSSLDPSFGNAFLAYFEKNWLQNCQSDFKPYYLRQDVDDMFQNI